MAYKHENLVVCGIDGSDESLNALRWAIQEARVRPGRLEIVCCYEEPTYSGHVGSAEAGLTQADAERLLAEARTEADVHGLESVETVASPEDSVSYLVQRSKKAARIVIGARGGSAGFADRLLGPVANAVSSRSYCATVIVPANDVSAVLPAKHIVCGVDGSEASRGALRLAIREAARWGARLSCVSAVNFGGGAWMPSSQYHRNVIEDVREGMRRIVDESMQGLSVDVRCHAVEGNPAAVLTEFTTTVDALVVGTRGRGGFAGLLLGSTSQTILQHTACPTIVVPARAADNENELVVGAAWGPAF